MDEKKNPIALAGEAFRQNKDKFVAFRRRRSLSCKNLVPDFSKFVPKPKPKRSLQEPTFIDLNGDSFENNEMSLLKTLQKKLQNSSNADRKFSIQLDPNQILKELQKMGVKEAESEDEETLEKTKRKVASSKDLPSLDIEHVDIEEKIELAHKKFLDKSKKNTKKKEEPFDLNEPPKRMMNFKKKSSILDHLEFHTSKKEDEF